MQKLTYDDLHDRYYRIKEEYNRLKSHHSSQMQNMKLLENHLLRIQSSMKGTPLEVIEEPVKIERAEAVKKRRKVRRVKRKEPKLETKPVAEPDPELSIPIIRELVRKEPKQGSDSRLAQELREKSFMVSSLRNRFAVLSDRFKQLKENHLRVINQFAETSRLLQSQRDKSTSLESKLSELSLKAAKGSETMVLLKEAEEEKKLLEMENSKLMMGLMSGDQQSAEKWKEIDGLRDEIGENQNEVRMAKRQQIALAEAQREGEDMVLRLDRMRERERSLEEQLKEKQNVDQKSLPHTIQYHTGVQTDDYQPIDRKTAATPVVIAEPATFVSSLEVEQQSYPVTLEINLNNFTSAEKGEYFISFAILDHPVVSTPLITSNTASVLHHKCFLGDSVGLLLLYFDDFDLTFDLHRESQRIASSSISMKPLLVPGISSYGAGLKFLGEGVVLGHISLTVSLVNPLPISLPSQQITLATKRKPLFERISVNLDFPLLTRVKSVFYKFHTHDGVLTFPNRTKNGRMLFDSHGSGTLPGSDQFIFEANDALEVFLGGQLSMIFVIDENSEVLDVDLSSLVVEQDGVRRMKAELQAFEDRSTWCNVAVSVERVETPTFTAPVEKEKVEEEEEPIVEPFQPGRQIKMTVKTLKLTLPSFIKNDEMRNLFACYGLFTGSPEEEESFTKTVIRPSEGSFVPFDHSSTVKLDDVLIERFERLKSGSDDYCFFSLSVVQEGETEDDGDQVGAAEIFWPIEGFDQLIKSGSLSLNLPVVQLDGGEEGPDLGVIEVDFEFVE